MKKIAILSPGHLPVPAVKGGAVETLITYLIELNEKKHKYDIDLYTIDDKKLNNVKYKYTKIIKIKNYFIFRVIFKILNILCSTFNINKLYNYYAIKCVKYMNKNNKLYDSILVENNMIIYGELSRKYKYFNQPKKYFHLHNVIYEKDEKSFNHLFKIISKTVNKVLAVSNYMKEYFESKTSNCNIEVLYNCIDFDNYNKKIIGDRTQLREKMKIYKFNFIFTGRCVEDKGVLELVNTFIKLYNKHKNCSLSICGMNLNKPSIFEKKIIKLSKSNENIHLFNYTNKNNLLKIISTSDCVVIPSMCDEAFGVVALEAMAMKKTIISTNSGGLTEPLNNDCSIIIERNNIEKNLYNAMEKILIDREFAQQLADNAYNRVYEIPDFNKEYYLNNFMDKTREDE